MSLRKRMMQVLELMLPRKSPLRRGCCRKTLMAFGHLDHSQTLVLFVMQTLVLHSMCISPSSGVCLFIYFSWTFSDCIFLGLKKGAKQVAWKGIREANEWFIDETFLLSLRTFDNPTRLTEHNLRAYWKHWYNLSQSGKPFTFKRTGARDPSSHTN